MGKDAMLPTNDFSAVISIIENAKGRALKAVNAAADGSVSSFSASGKQPVVTFTAGRTDPILCFFNVEVASGTLTICKQFTDASGNELSDVTKSGVQVQIVGQSTGYTATYTTDAGGTISALFRQRHFISLFSRKTTRKKCGQVKRKGVIFSFRKDESIFSFGGDEFLDKMLFVAAPCSGERAKTVDKSLSVKYTNTTS